MLHSKTYHQNRQTRQTISSFNPTRKIYLNENPDRVDSQKDSFPKSTDRFLRRIDTARIEKDLHNILCLLIDHPNERKKGENMSIKFIIFKLKLYEIEERYEKAEATATAEDLALEKEIYDVIGPLLKKAAASNLEKCDHIKDPIFEKQGLRFTFDKEKMTAKLDSSYNIQQIQLQGITIQFLEPHSFEDFDQTIGHRVLRVLGNIKKRFPDAKNITIQEDHGRYEFSITKNQETKKYVATIQDILEVKEEATPQCKSRVLEAIDELGSIQRVIEDPGAKSFSWKYLDKDGNLQHVLDFISGHCSRRTHYEKGKASRQYLFNETGSLRVDKNLLEGWKDQYDGKGHKLFRKTFDPASEMQVEIDTYLYDDQNNLLNETTLKTMPLAKIEKNFLEKLEQPLSKGEKVIVVKAVMSAARYISYCPRGKEILLKAANLDPDTTFSRYNKYKDILYASDILEAAAYRITPLEVTNLLQGEQFVGLLPAEKNKLIKISAKRESNQPIAQLLVNNSPKYKSQDDELMKDPALMHLGEVKEGWLESYWHRIKKPLDADLQNWKAQIKAMIVRNLYFQQKKVTEENVVEELLRIETMRAKYKNIPLFKGRNIIIGAHSELLEDNKGVIFFERISSGDSHTFGKSGLLDAIKKQQNDNDTCQLIRPDKDFDSLTKAKKNILEKITTTPPPMTFIFDGHAGPEGLYLSDGQIAGVTDPDKVIETAETTKISVSELAKALIERFKKFPQLKSDDSRSNDPHNKDILIFASCYNATFIRNLYAQLGNVPKPIALGESEYGQYGFSNFASSIGSDFFKNILGIGEKDNQNPSTFDDIFKNEFKEFKRKSSINPSLYIPDEANETMQIAENGQGSQEDEVVV